MYASSNCLSPSAFPEIIPDADAIPEKIPISKDCIGPVKVIAAHASVPILP